MKSNIGFMQILTFIFVILHSLQFIEVNTLLMVGLIIVAWGDSYLKID